MSKSKALKFGVISAGIIAVLWFLKYKIATPQTGAGSGEREDESAGGGIGGGGIGGPTDLTGLNHMANNLPGNQTPSTPAGPTSTEASFQLNTSALNTAPPKTLTPEYGGDVAKPGRTATSVPLSSQLGFNGKTTLGFIGDERKLRSW